MVFRKLPAAVDVAPCVRARKCQGVDAAGLRLEIVKGGYRSDRVTKCLVGGHVGDARAVNIDVAPVVQTLDVSPPCLDRNHFPSQFRGWSCASPRILRSS